MQEKECAPWHLMCMLPGCSPRDTKGVGQGMLLQEAGAAERCAAGRAGH